VAVHSQQEGLRRSMANARVSLGPHDHLVPRVLQQQTPPALPADRLSPGAVCVCTLPPVDRRQGTHQQGAHHRHPDRAVGLLGGMSPVPLLRGGLDAAVVDAAALSSSSTGRHGLLHGGVRQEHRVASRAVVPPLPLTDHHRLARIGLPVAAMMRPPVRRRASRVIRGQPSDPDHRGLPPRGPRRAALPLTEGVPAATSCAPLPSGRWRPCVCRHGHVVLGRHHQGHPLLVAPPQRSPLPQPARNDDLVQAGVAGHVGARLERTAGAWMGTTFPAKGLVVRPSLKTLSCQPARVTSIACTWPRVSVIGRWRVTWPQPSYGAVVSRSVASTRPVRLAATTPVRASARLAPLHPAARSRRGRGTM
jgi:hypothetical protein